jgi:XTP/dITP diphosphohydrolase
MFYGGLKGYIGLESRGEGGFGYDPVFMLPDSGKALAELSREEKNRISHRGQALARFKKFLSA